MPIDTQLMLNAYRMGVFPMADSRDDEETYWVEPQMRAIIPLDGLNISKSLRKKIRQDRFEVTSDQAFEEVISTCGQSASDRNDTWINDDIEKVFIELHHQGHAHSVECWQIIDDKRTLVGGLYGLAIGRLFCGESMFSRASDASKVALVWLVARLRAGGFEILDCQFMTDHLQRMGAIELPQSEYLTLLRKVLRDDYSSSVSGKESIRSSKSLISSSGSIISSSITSSASSTIGSGSVAGCGAGSATFVDSSLGAPVVGDWTALDSLLSSARSCCSFLKEDKESTGDDDSPGKSMMQSFTQTS